MNAPAPYGARSSAPRAPHQASRRAADAHDHSDWSTPTSVRSAAAAHAQQSDVAYDPRPVRRERPSLDRERLERERFDRDRLERDRFDRDRPDRAQVAHAEPERGLPGWAALVVLLVIAGIGGLIDTMSGAQARGGFNYGIVIASIVAILVVRRSAMFPIVIAPPIVYSLASGAMLYIRSSGLHDKKVLFDGAANWLVYGFPAIAAATAAVLIIAGLRMIIRR